MSFTTWWRHTDRVLLFAAILLAIVGMVCIGSATHINRGGWQLNSYVEKQLIFFATGCLFFGFLQRFEYRKLFTYSWWIYGLNALVLVAVMVVGERALGAQRWLQIGSFSFQPSEFAKIAYIICLARFLCSSQVDLTKWRGVLLVGLFLAVPFGLVFLQPDLGTSLVFGAITLGGSYMAGIRKYFLKVMGYAGLVLSVPIWFWGLHDYQRRRILTLFNPDLDPYASGYHVIQSKIAIGSGGLIGKGLFSGTQSQLDFLPENHTDFIFAVVGEEFGWVGAMVILLMYFVILYRGVRIASTAQDDFGRYIAIGVVSMWLFQIFINIGMTIGIMPVTGIPLPFISYGVSSLVVNLCGTALLLNVYQHRKQMLF